MADLPQRRSIRLKGYDYTREGAYFVTVCTQDKKPLFGKAVDGKMVPSAIGEIVQGCWDAIPDHMPMAICDAFVVMPDHVHGIIVIREVAADRSDVTGGEFAVTRNVYRAGLLPRDVVAPSVAEVWQRNYYKHIIRDEADWIRIADYIRDNPANWDRFQNP